MDNKKNAPGAIRRKRQTGDDDTSCLASSIPQTGGQRQDEYADATPSRVMCEMCGAREVIPLGEQARRMDETGNILCSDCYDLYWTRQHINTTGGTAIHWSICDTIHAMRVELVDAGVFCENDPQLWALVMRAYDKMKNANYLTADDRAAMEQKRDDGENETDTKSRG